MKSRNSIVYNTESILYILPMISEYIFKWQLCTETVRTTYKINSPVEKRPLGRLKIRWENTIKKDVEALRGGLIWKILSFYRGFWRIV